MANKKPPRRRPQPSAQRGRVRNGLPTVPELRHALRVLQIPPPPEQLADEPLEHQRTLLLVLLTSWLETYLRAQRDIVEAPREEFYTALVDADEGIAAGDERRGLLSFVMQRIERGQVAAAALDQYEDPFEIGAPLRTLLHAARQVGDAACAAYMPPSADIDDEGSAVTVLAGPPNTKRLHAAHAAAAQALEQIDAVLARDAALTELGTAGTED